MKGKQKSVSVIGTSVYVTYYTDKGQETEVISFTSVEEANAYASTLV